MQDKMESKIKKLKKYNPRIQERKDLRNIILDNAKKLSEGRDVITKAFRKHIFQFYDSESDSESDSTNSSQNFKKSVGERVKLRRQESDILNEMITKNDKTIKKDLFTEYFQFQSAMQKLLSKTQNTQKK